MNAFPVSVALSKGVDMTRAMSANDKEMLDALEAKGVRVKRGTDGDGFPEWLLVKQGSCYADQGANGMIVDGRIKVVGCEEGVVDVDARGVVLKKGKGWRRRSGA